MDGIVGASVRVRVRVTDQAGAPVDAPDLAGVATLPDGSTVPLAPVRESLGVYHADLTLTQAGRHAVRWSSAALAFVATDVVHAVAGDLLLSLDDVRAQLNITPDDTRHDTELLRIMRAVTEVIERYAGAVLPRTVTDTRQGGGSATLVTAVFPVISVTAVTEDGAAVDPSVYYLDGAAGVLYRTSGLWNGLVTVTYRAGRIAVPERALEAARIIVQDMWQLQQGPMPQLQGAVEAFDPRGYSIPRRARELLGDLIQEIV